MLVRLRHMIMLVFSLFGAFEVASQVAMPDYVYIGALKHYSVIPNPAPGSTYTWKIDSVIQIGFKTHEIDITWNAAGKYLLEVQERSPDGCFGPVRMGQVFVNPLPVLTAEGINPAICDADGSIRFTLANVPDGTHTIIYDTGIFNNVVVKDSSAAVTAPFGIYNNLKITIKGYTTTPGVNITIKALESPPQPLVSVNKNVTCKGLSDGEISVAISGSHTHYYYSLDGGMTWSETAFSSPWTIRGLSPKSYSVIVKDTNGCVSAPSAIVTIGIYDIGIIIPGGFSPNGDGINEYFYLKGLENYPKSELYVYTRSGQLVYQSKDYRNDWDGATVQSTLTSKKVVPTGVYYYVLKLGGTNRSLKEFVYIGY